MNKFAICLRIFKKKTLYKGAKAPGTLANPKIKTKQDLRKKEIK